jgi:hypothetical protein
MDDEEFLHQARSISGMILNELCRLARSDEARVANVMACKELLDRAYGKVEAKSDAGKPAITEIKVTGV